MDDAGFLHIRESKSASEYDDHFVRLSHIVSVSIRDDSRSGDGFDVVVTTAATRSYSGSSGEGSASVTYVINFRSRQQAEGAVKLLMEAIDGAG